MAAGQQDQAVQMAGTSGTRIKENRWKAETVQVTASDSWPQKVMTKQPDAEGMNSSYMRLRSSTVGMTTDQVQAQSSHMIVGMQLWNQEEAIQVLELSILGISPPPVLPPICESIDADLVCACLRSAENTAPGPDRIAYKHWREIDPSGRILTLLYNICLSLRKVPSSWKQSETILIHKKGSTEDISNWRPIALSNTIYKLFTKCLARKLADWCSANDCLSNSQKGFTPFDGVLEHKFVIN
ncbi:retrovirus-related Pol polyprotein from type-2 retrotransposable element R2DM [Nephila pilipes]|uniref:Retrovirus-related Pol polyprotein from type-2 retrotransposable element R2DM n=1 Tax=Nephila pilipes TaxID=299642 RepID=A0A8X6P485_NEPPI|nr:retrovirus-related Pol polyprotein from type-2 retrotransposable element R2DM [Nephila pilipes]